MRSGELRNVVTIQRPATEATQDSTGQIVDVPVTVCQARASIEQLSARERFNEQQLQATATHRLRLRWQPEFAGIDASWRVLFGDRVFEVISHDNVGERNREIVLICQEGPLA
jgi:SPP1 family predicted phage head-tail adaptor